MRLFQDTIARRFAVTMVSSIVVAVCLTALLVQAAGVWGRPSVEDLQLLERADDIARIVESIPTQQRRSVADAAGDRTFGVSWYPTASSTTAMLHDTADTATGRDVRRLGAGEEQHRIVVFGPNDRHPQPAALFQALGPPGAYFLCVELRDSSWLVFTAPTRVWGLGRPTRIAIAVVLLTLSVTAVSAIATYFLSAPIKEFAQAVRRFGVDPRAAAIPESGPSEFRQLIAAFNAMQAQIQKFVEDRTAMLAAISHDLRTPLTKMRLRGEFIADERQRARLSRDVEDMQAMVDSALAFFRDDIEEERTTSFDLPELLRTIADDFGDHGCDIAYFGAARLAFVGRPFALKRAITNLVDNAVKYGRTPELELVQAAGRITIAVRDSGPGIPPSAAERVFDPFFRLETSRNRATGGVGLGLTSARAVVRAHGGDIVLLNRPIGGLEVRVSLPALIRPG